MPRVLPFLWGHIGGGSDDGAIIVLRGRAAYAVGTPRVSLPNTAGNAYFAPNSTNSRSCGLSKTGWRSWYRNKPAAAARFNEACTAEPASPVCKAKSAYVAA